MTEYYLEKLLYLILTDKIDYKPIMIRLILDLPEDNRHGFSRGDLLQMLEGAKE
jgi:hypothetical protein